MKKLLIIAMLLIATFAMAADMHKCCIKSAEAGKGCCGKDAETVKTAYEDYKLTLTAEETAKAGLHKCCAKSLDAGKGCCGMKAEELQAKYDTAVIDSKTEAIAACKAAAEKKDCAPVKRGCCPQSGGKKACSGK
jgi:hypothetical protein